MASAFGAVGARLALWWARLRWLWRLAPRVQRLADRDRRLLLHVLDTLESPLFPLAQASVQRTAHTLGFNRPEAWVALSRLLKHDKRAQENNFRHLEACRLLQANVIGSTLSNPECHLLVELAYHRYTLGR